MKTSKLLITSLLAAATLSVPAYADDVSGDVAVSAGNSTAYVMTDDTTFTFTNNPTLTGSISGAYTLTTSGNATLATGFGGTDDTRWTDGNLVVSAGTLQWGQGNTGAASANQTKALGETISVSSGAALKIHLWTGKDLDTSTDGKVNITSKIILNGTSTLETADGSYYFSGGIQVGDGSTEGTATFRANWDKAIVISSLSGSGTMNFVGANTTWGAPLFSLGGNGGFSGTLNVTSTSLHLTSENAASGATLNIAGGASLYLDATTNNVKGLSGSGSVVAATAGNTLAIATETGVTNTFSGTVGTSTSAVGLSVSGSGTQTLAGTSYLGDVSVTGGSLSLGGTVSLANTVSVSGSASVSVNDSVIFILNDSYKADDTWTLISGGSSVSGWSNLTLNNFRKADGSLFSGRSGISVGTSGVVSITEGTSASLIWNGTSGNSTWNTSTTNKNWTNDNLPSEDKADSFYTLDNVTFKSLENVVTTVTLENGADIKVGDMTVESGDYTLNAGAGNSATISGSTLTVASGATLTLSNQLKGEEASALRLGFEDISLSGTIRVNTNSTDSWSSLTFATAGANLHLYDIGGNESTTGFTIASIIADAAGTLSSTWGGKMEIGALSGSGNVAVALTETTQWSNNLNVVIGDLSEYSGTLTLTDTATSGALTLSVDSTKIGSDARIVVGADTTLKMNVLEEQNTSNDYTNLSGTGTLALGLKNDNGVGFNLSNFEGTIRVERGTGVTAASRFQLDTSTLNANARIVVAAGNDLVFNGTGTNISNAVTFEGSSSVYVNQNKTGEFSGDVNLATGTLTKAGAGGLTLSGTSNIERLNVSAGSVTYSSGTHTVGSISGSVTVSGGSLTISGSAASTIGTLAVNGAVEVGGASNTTISTALSGSNTLTKTGTGTLTVSGATIGGDLTLAVDNGTLAWTYKDNAQNTAADITIGTNGVFRTTSAYKFGATFSGTISGDGTFAVWTPTYNTSQTEYARVVTLSGDASGFTGELQLDTSYGSDTANRRVYGVLNTSNGVFGGVVAFKSNLNGTSTTAVVESVECARLYILKDTEIGGLDGALSGTVVAGATTVTGATQAAQSVSVTDGNHALTIKVADGKSYDYAGTIASTISGITKTGAGTQILSGDNSAYAGTTTLEAGTLGVGHANALGTGAVNVTGNAKLALGEGLGISNNISIADSVKLTLGGGYAVALNGAITGSGTLRADMLWQTVALGGDNSGFSGAVEVVGSTVDVAHASALGTGMVKISSAVSTVGETTVPVSGSIQASTANVELHDVAIGLVETDSAALRTSSSGSFTVASGVTLYLDVSLLNKTSWSDEVALMITAQNAITDGTFFNEVLVGTFDSGDNWINDTEWAYKAGSWDAATGTLSLISVPEPSSFGLLAGAGALALVAARRRRTKKA